MVNLDSLYEKTYILNIFIAFVLCFKPEIWKNLQIAAILDAILNISESTFKLLKDKRDLKFESRGKTEAKGNGEMDMYFVSSRLFAIFIQPTNLL